MILYSILHYMQSWFLPPGINFLIATLGFFLWFYSRMAGGILMMAGVLSLWLLSMPIIAYNLVNSLQNKYPILTADDLKNPKIHSAIVVLDGGDAVQAEYNNKHTVSDFTLHRINYAVYLQRQTHLPIILSGGKSNGSGESSTALMSASLRDNFNIKADYIEDKSLTTADESRFLRPILKQNKFDEIYLVTNAWHIPRSVYIFKCAGIKVIPAPMGHYVYGPGYALISYFPNMDALYASSIAIHEFIGLIWYRVHYGSQCI
jgi:uncharacterized SAM-binding protein YcdF (DUF218 family)